MFAPLQHVPAKWDPVRRQGHAAIVESTAFPARMGSPSDPIRAGNAVGRDHASQEAGCDTLRKPGATSKPFAGALAGRRASRMMVPAARAATPIDMNIGVGL